MPTRPKCRGRGAGSGTNNTGRGMSFKDRATSGSRPRARRVALCSSLLVLAGLSAAAGAGAQLPVTDPPVPAARDTEPVVLTGRDFGTWSARSNFTARLPLLDLADCQTFDEKCQHNH